MTNWPRALLYALKVSLSYVILIIICSSISRVSSGSKEVFLAALTNVTSVMAFTIGETLNRCMINLVSTLLGASIGYVINALFKIFNSTEETRFLVALACIFGIIGGVLWYTEVLKGWKNTGSSLLLAVGGAFLSTSSSYDLKSGVVGVVVGVIVCLFMTMICPVSARADLHTHITQYLDKFSTFFDGLEKLENDGFESIEGKPFMRSLETVMNSKEEEDSLLKFVNWEPHHRQFWFPSDQYTKIGNLCRNWAGSYCYHLCHHLLDLSKDPSLISDWNRNPEVREACFAMSSALVEALRSLHLSMELKTMPSPSIKDNLLTALDVASDVQNERQFQVGIWRILSPIVWSVKITDELAELVDELARVAGYSQPVNVVIEEEMPLRLHDYTVSQPVGSGHQWLHSLFGNQVSPLPGSAMLPDPFEQQKSYSSPL